LVIGQQALVDDVRELPLEAAAGFRGGLGLGELALVVLALTGQPVPAKVAAGGLDWGGAAVAGVVVSTGEAGDVPAVGDDLGGEDRSETVDLSLDPPLRFSRRLERVG